MLHVDITKTERHGEIAQFTHINQDIHPGDWTKERPICLDHFKINIFMDGDFSVIVKDESFNPIYGDLCVLPPNTTHYGLIPKTTRANYYQLDIGFDAFYGVPGGRELLNRLDEAARTDGSFLRPDKQTINTIVRLCQKIENAISDGDFTPAFVYVLETACIISDLYKIKSKAMSQALSLHVRNVIKYIENNYMETLSITDIANHCRVSTSYICRQFKKEVGVTIHSYVNNYRILKALEIIKTHSVTETTYLCGFSDSSHFISVFKSITGTTPAEYQKKNKRDVRLSDYPTV